MKPSINTVEVHPQLSNNGHPLDGVLVGAGSIGSREIIVELNLVEPPYLWISWNDVSANVVHVFPGGLGPTILHNGSHHIEIVLTTEMRIETILFFIQRMKFCLLHFAHTAYMPHTYAPCSMVWVGRKKGRKESSAIQCCIQGAKQLSFFFFIKATNLGCTSFEIRLPIPPQNSNSFHRHHCFHH
jgi:hypothetical protein